MRGRCWLSVGRARWLLLLCIFFHAIALCQEKPYTDNPYTYVKMSLTVPWTLYFVFLACVLIPFVLMVILAWRKAPDDEPKEGSAPQ